MKIGFQTIVWGPRYRTLKYMLDVIAAAGYQGVQFFQPPKVLGSIEHILELLRERGLQLIGLSGGSLGERMHFCGGYRPEYLYLDSWDSKACGEAMSEGFTLGIHPHAYMPIGRLADALRLLRDYPADKYPKLKFVPDTAHLTVTHDDPVDAIRQTKDRIVAVHLKDWSPEFGRSSHRYARGFTELGAGSVELDAVVNLLKEIRYDGWLIVEQDYTVTGPDTNTLESARWLLKRKLLSNPPHDIKSRAGLAIYANRQVCSRKKEVLFLRSIRRVPLQDINSWYETIARAFHRLVPCKLVEIWTCSPVQDIMSLVAIPPVPSVSLKTFILKRQKVLSGDTVERKTVTHFDLTNKETAKRFEHPELVSRFGLKKMVSIPIFNPWSFNHVRLIINLFPHDEKSVLNDDELSRFGEHVAFTLDSALEQVCSTCAAKVNFTAGRCKQVQDFLDSLVELIKTSIDCQGVAIFLVNAAGNKLELKATTATKWTVPESERFYRKGEGLTGRVWERKETLLTGNARLEWGRKEKSLDIVQSPEEDAGLFVPLTKPTGEVVGVFRCRNKSSRRRLGESEVFVLSDDDAAILEAIAQAAIPHLELLLGQERRAKALGRLTHELKVPLVAIRGAAEFIVRTPGINKFLDYDYPGDIYSWSELIGRLVDNADLLRYSTDGMSVRAEPTFLIRDVIAPAIKQVRLLLNERGFSRLKISYKHERFDESPKFWLDRNRFQQVIFNLLSNAIKYAYDEPEAFEIEIDGTKNTTGFVIWFRDWGPGIETGMEEMIFEEGFRGENAVQMNVTGEGLGLWVARQIVERHGGDIRVSNLHLPTEFEISLPYSLTSQPPS